MIKRVRLAISTVLLLPLLVAGGQRPAGGTHLTKNDLYKLWSNLGSDDAKIAFQALNALTLAQEKSVAYLKPRLQPRLAAKPERLRQLVQDLDNEDDETRDLAIQELERLGELAEPALRSALAERPSEKLRSELKGLLSRISEAKLSAEQLRVLRAIEVLERVGSPGAEEVLQDLAKGAPTARATKEARAALERLKKRGGS